MLTAAEVKTNNKRILKNTIVLYVRMVFTMGLGFFTTRELLSALGVVDFGLVNIIGSIVAMFSFLSGTMQATISRYICNELGRKDFARLKNIFSLTLLIYVIIITIVFILAETVGLWFLEHHLVISPERKIAGHYFYQFTIVAFIFNIISMPYSALIISHEDLKTYSFITTIESIARLCIVYILYISDYDRFVYYGALLGIVYILLFATYFIYCFMKYKESHFAFYWEKNIFTEMMTFAGWNLWGALSGLFSNVFVNILLNNYFGPIVNAARGIALQGATGVGNFVTNFLTAAKPQIFKYYAESNYALAIDLTMKVSRIGYFLLLFFSLPVIFEMSFILKFWLHEVPQYTSLFMRLILVQRLIDIMTYPLVTLAQAAGRVAIYQTVVGILQWLTFPLSWIVLKLGGQPASVFWIAIVLSIIALLAQFYIISRIINLFSIQSFISQVVFPVMTTTVVSIIFPLIAYASQEEGVMRFFTICTLCAISTCIGILCFGLKSQERRDFVYFAKNKLRIL